MEQPAHSSASRLRRPASASLFHHNYGAPPTLASTLLQPPCWIDPITGLCWPAPLSPPAPIAPFWAHPAASGAWLHHHIPPPAFALHHASPVTYPRADELASAESRRHDEAAPRSEEESCAEVGSVGRGKRAPQRYEFHTRCPDTHSHGQECGIGPRSESNRRGGRGNTVPQADLPQLPGSSWGPDRGIVSISQIHNPQPSCIEQPVYSPRIIARSISNNYFKTSSSFVARANAARSGSKTKKGGGETCWSPLSASGTPHPGALGRKVLVRVNHFLIKLTSCETIYQYDVMILPATVPDTGKQNEAMSKDLTRAIEQEFVDKFTCELEGRLPVFDGSHTMYTAGPLPFESLIRIVHLPSSPDTREPKSFRVAIQLVASRDHRALLQYLEGREFHTSQDILQALTIVFRENPSRHLTISGKYFFSKAFGESNMTRDSLTVWKGFWQSVLPTQQGLVLNVDLSAMAFYKSIPILDYLKCEVPDFNPTKELSPRQLEMVRKALDQLRVQVTHRASRKKYKIVGLSPGKTEDLKFILGEGEGAVNKEIVAYFKETYNHNIRYRKLPCIQVCASKTTYLPMEVCKISEGQKFVGKLTETDKHCLQRLKKMDPRQREERLGIVMTHDYGPSRGKFLEEFGIAVNSKLTPVQARHLQPPSLKYAQNGAVKVISPKADAGKWNLMDGAQVFEGFHITDWTVVNFDSLNTSLDDVVAFSFRLSARCKELGVWMSEKTTIPPISRSADFLVNPKLEWVMHRILQDIKEANKNRLQLLICVMGEKHSSYGALKKYADIDLGIVTQCCLSANVKNATSPVLANLAFKINAKLGGQNVALVREIPHICRALSKPTMILGADVSHPQAGDDKAPSIAAVVANLEWPSPRTYVARFRSQESRLEIIKELGDMVRELWRTFCENSKQIPERILMFRDGVGGGQFDAVLEKEVKMLKQAFREVGGEDYDPKITLTIVNKSHNTRLFPADSPRQERASLNILPGTVIDTTITHPQSFNFYLCSHAGVRGTSKPAHYHVIWDEIGFESDELQNLIYHLCYTYARCTRSVSVVPPAYYAHLAAFRARHYLQPTCTPQMPVPPLPNPHRRLKNTMHYL